MSPVDAGSLVEVASTVELLPVVVDAVDSAWVDVAPVVLVLPGVGSPSLDEPHADEAKSSAVR